MYGSALLLYRSLAVTCAVDVALCGVHNDGEAKDDEEDSDDQLKSVCDEDSTPGGLTCRDGYGCCGLNSLDHRDQTLNECGESDAEHDDEWREEHLIATTGHLQEDAKRNQYECRQELVCGTEQRPDVCIADTGQNEAAQQG